MKKIGLIIIIVCIVFQFGLVFVKGQSRNEPLTQNGCDVEKLLEKCVYQDIKFDFACQLGFGAKDCAPCLCIEDLAKQSTDVDSSVFAFYGSFDSLLGDVDLVCPEQRVNIIVIVGYSTAISLIILVIIIRGVYRNASMGVKSVFLGQDSSALKEELKKENPEDVIAILVIGSFWGIIQIVLGYFGLPALTDILTGTVSDVCALEEKSSIGIGNKLPNETVVNEAFVSSAIRCITPNNANFTTDVDSGTLVKNDTADISNNLGLSDFQSILGNLNLADLIDDSGESNLGLVKEVFMNSISSVKADLNLSGVEIFTDGNAIVQINMSVNQGIKILIGKDDTQQNVNISNISFTCF